MRAVAVLSLVLFSIAVLHAQEYLITTKGDTVRGQINFRMNGKIESAAVKGEKRETFSAIGTREVMMNGKRYKPTQFNASVTFMQILSDGYLSLLAYRLPDKMTYDGMLLQKRDGKILDVPGIGFRKLMSNFLSDYPALSEKIQAGTLNRNDLTQIINEYNDFILNNTKAEKKETVPDTKPLGMIDRLVQLQSDVEKSDLSQKQDALDILSDWIEKVKAGKPVPPYMVRSLQEVLESRNDLLEQLNKIDR